MTEKGYDRIACVKCMLGVLDNTINSDWGTVYKVYVSQPEDAAAFADPSALWTYAAATVDPLARPDKARLFVLATKVYPFGNRWQSGWVLVPDDAILAQVEETL